MGIDCYGVKQCMLESTLDGLSCDILAPYSVQGVLS